MTSAAPTGLSAVQREQIERWLLRHGLPHFIVGYRASTDVFTRATWLLALILIAELPFTSRLGFPGSRVVTPLLAAVLVAGCYLGVNALRGRRLWQRPQSIGRVELGVFVLVPALAHGLLKQEWVSALGLAGLNVLLLGVIYAWTSYAVLPVLRSALVQAAHQILDVLNVLLKSLPLLLVFSMFAFVNADTWGMASTIKGPLLAIALGLIVGLGGLFLIARSPQELRRMAAFGSWPQVESDCDGTPAAGIAPRSTQPPDELNLSVRERVNVAVLAVGSQAVQVTIVSAAIGAFFFAFGLFLISPDTIAQWSGHTAEQVRAHQVGPTLTLFGSDVVVTRELIIVSLFVAVVSGLQFLIAALTDPTYRTEFTDELTGRLRQALAVRAVYRDAIGAP